MVKKLYNEMEYLKEEVGKLRKDNSELRLRLSLWERRNKLNDDDATEWRNGDDSEKEAAEGSPTPVWKRSEEPDFTRLIQEQGEDQEMSEMKKQKEIVSVLHKKGERMKTEEMLEPENNRSLHKEGSSRNDRTESPEIPHRTFLEDCFNRQIGLPLNKRQTKNIYSFTNKMVAKGYMKVVTTNQGMYYELVKEQVCWESFKDRKITIDGDWCWRSWGVTVYNPARDRTKRTIVPHRFAIRPIKNTTRGRLRTDRY